MKEAHKIQDVIIIGAGYAGLTAARTLFKAGKQILLFEARDRVGGRVWTRQLDEHTYVDLGAQWVGPGQEKLYALAREFGIETFPTHDAGKSQMYFQNRIKSYNGLIPPLPIPALISLNNALKKMNRLSATVNTETPWLHPKAAVWDRITLEEWMHRQMKNRTARKLFAIAAEAIFAANPAEISFLFSLFYTRSGKDFDTLMNIRNGAQQDRFYGGADLPAKKIAEGLGDMVRLNMPVSKVVCSNQLATVSGDGFSYSARKIIIAIPPALVSRIQFEPTLPVSKLQLFQRMPMGCVWKCYAIYDQPFWRKQGLNGLVAADSGHTTLVFDNSPRDGERGILMGFVLADKARTFSKLDEVSRRQSILESFTKFFGPEAATPLTYLDQGWASETWSGGCYTGLMGPHTLTALGPYLRESTGHIHWAGTETSEIWNGYIEGAIRSGERAATEVLQAI